MRLSTIHYSLFTLIIAFALMSLASCNPEVKAVSGMKVKVTIQEEVVSSGFMSFHFESSEEAYYHVGIVPVEQAPDTSRSSSVRTFMALMLDKAYADYLYWRSDLLEQGTPYVAEFPTHSLQYGAVDYNFTLLTPDTEYMVFAFVVDAKTNKPDGRLFTHYVRTEPLSLYEEAIQFEYRVRGYWDYIYPVSILGDILSWVPWVGATVDSLELMTIEQLSCPAEYFVNEFTELFEYKEFDRIHFGIYAHENNGIGDGSSTTYFEEGHTYYTAIALMDGYLSATASAIYKFRWQGNDTQLYFTPDQTIGFDW